MIRSTMTMQTYNGELIHFRRSLCGWVATFDLGFDLSPRIVHFHRPMAARDLWTAWLPTGQEPLAIGDTLHKVFKQVCVFNTGIRSQRFFRLLEETNWSIPLEYDNSAKVQAEKRAKRKGRR